MNKILLKNITDSSITKFTDPMYELFIFKDIDKYNSYVYADFALHNLVAEIESLFIKNEIHKSEKIYILESYLKHFEKILLEIETNLNKSDLDDSLKFSYKRNKRKFTECIEYLKEELNLIITTERENNKVEDISHKSGHTKISELYWEDKTELSELIYVLYHSKRIIKNGKPIQQNELTEIFCNLFNIDIKTPVDLLNKTAKTFKKSEDGETFINELNKILNSYIDKIRDKE